MGLADTDLSFLQHQAEVKEMTRVWNWVKPQTKITALFWVKLWKGVSYQTRTCENETNKQTR